MEKKEIKALRINLASPEVIRSWSYGEVLKPETINYRRLRPEKDGLFCEAIFGPTRDYQCYCGKYKNQQHQRGLVCDKCGVEITKSNVRRERMGHIELATPVAHVWYSRRTPSYLGLLLDISRRNLDRVLYFAQYIVTTVDEVARQKALSKLDSEIGTSERELGEKINMRIAEKKKERDRRYAEIDNRAQAISKEYDDQVARAFEPVISQGQDLEREIHEKMGKIVRKAIVFQVDGGDLAIVEAGEEVSARHIARVQTIVQSRMNAIERPLKLERIAMLEPLKMEREEVKAEADLVMEGLRNQLEDKKEETKNENAHLRDELYELRPFTFLSESRYRELRSRWGNVFKADTGAEAFYDILKKLDMNKLSEDLWQEIRTTNSKQKRKKATSRLNIVEAFRKSSNRPEWMILTVLPVIPPDLRPMVQLDGGRFATSDLNDLYRRVINRNNRLKRLLELGAPDVIVRNEKRMLQEAVDSLVDNSQRKSSLSRRGRRELRSLSDMLKGKKGRFRRNLLGKRVDFSGRSVIVVGPHLKLHQCGLPKAMALELYKPFVLGGLATRAYVQNVKGGKKYIERNRPEVWEVLEEVIKDRPVLLNRAPTLHRLGIQAFEPVLVEGSAIQLHPLVTTAFNADFDGDQMAVHIPLSTKAVIEARDLMLASKNLLKPASGEPIISPGKDMVLGVYYLTQEPITAHVGDGRIFGSINEVILAYGLEQVHVHTRIQLMTKSHFYPAYDHAKKLANDQRMPEPEKRLIQTTVGRAIFNDILPEEMLYCNIPLDKNGVRDLIAEIHEVCGKQATTDVADAIKDIGFRYASQSGSTLSVADITVPPAKKQLIDAALLEVQEQQRYFQQGDFSEAEQNEHIIDIWKQTTEKVSAAVKAHMDPSGNLSVMAVSGATKGGFNPISQMAGMRGLMADPSGRIIPMPIQSNFREGLTAMEYFISTHGQRKGLADTAMRTADAGYLTRRLVDVAQDMIINNEDCGTREGIWINRSDNVADQSYYDRIAGRLLAQRVIDPETGEILAERNSMLTSELSRQISQSKVEAIMVRSPMTCELVHGVCARCYGKDLGTGEMVNLGATVGIVAAQSIGEPGTQLTLRTFHSGGVAAESDITSGLPRVEELFEARRMPKGEAIISQLDGYVQITTSNEQKFIHVDSSEMVSEQYAIPEGWTVLVENGSEAKIGDVIAKHEDTTICATHAGRVRVEEGNVVLSYESKISEEYPVPPSSKVKVANGQRVEAGQPLTEGSINPHNILRLRGRNETMLYLLQEIQKVYRSQGQNINDKHFEVIIRKMLNKVQITRPGDTHYLPQDLVDRREIIKLNEELSAKGMRPAKYIEILLGVSKASLNTNSFLSASSFQHTIKVLAGAAVSSDRDDLFGLKENVIIGKLIPAGTAFDPKRFAEQNMDVTPGDNNIRVQSLDLFHFDPTVNLDVSLEPSTGDHYETEETPEKASEILIPEDFRNTVPMGGGNDDDYAIADEDMRDDSDDDEEMDEDA